jgi:wobble nucleotide-excising tRNase
MPALPTILRITSLKGLGVFRDYIASDDVPGLQRYNLIYGFNGSGKTTLSRVLASLQAGLVRPELPEGGQFEIELTDGTTIRSKAVLEALRGRLLVFNVDFIEENLRWKEGTANPVFYLGRAQAELAKKMEEIEAAVTELELKWKDAARDHSLKQKAFGEHKRNAARLIAEELGLGRRYEASNLSADYSRGGYDDTLKLPQEQRLQLRSIINQDSPLAKRAPLNDTSIDLDALVLDVRKLLGTTLGTIALEDLRQHEIALKWVKDGLDYHQEHDLSHCLFCGNELTAERTAALRNAIDDKFERLTGEIAKAKQVANQLRNELGAIERAMPSSNDISKDLQPRFTAAERNLQRELSLGMEMATSIISLLERKSAAPNICVDAGGLPTEKEAAQWDSLAAQRLSDLNAVIEQHNRCHDEFREIQESAAKKLKEHFLAEGQTTYRELEAEVAATKSGSDEMEAKYRMLTQEADHIRHQMREHGPAAEIVNRMIRGYLGHNELEIGTLDSGYEIRRNGKPVAGLLSEGEKTAIALCYFLSTLQAEGRQLKDLIVVVDDPISSLDTRALHYAVSMIRGALEVVGQMIVMTHNLHFRNEVKKWLKPKVDKGTAALLFLDSAQDIGADTRSSSIKRMPALIREYESEYQYLFNLILQFIRAPDGHAGYFYLMPNALRKVLEIFLAFKLPGSEGLSNKVENVANGGHGLDPIRLRALDRLVQLESHADNLDDLVTFSSMTIEETKDAADALSALMQTLDRGHYDRLCKICS